MNSDDDITHMEIYKGNYYNKKRNRSSGRVIAFDLDETLGSFSDLEILWSSLQHFTKKYEPINFNSILKVPRGTWLRQTGPLAQGLCPGAWGGPRGALFSQAPVAFGPKGGAWGLFGERS